jgi:hypothetical protein
MMQIVQMRKSFGAERLELLTNHLESSTEWPAIPPIKVQSNKAKWHIAKKVIFTNLKLYT